jgi:integrase
MKAGRMTIPMFEIWLDERKNLAERSKQEYVRSVKQFLEGNPDIDEPDSYIKFLIKTSVKKRAYHNKYALKQYMEFALEDAKLRNDIWKQISDRRIKAKEPVKYKGKKSLSEKELEAVIDNLDSTKHKIITYIMYETGLRIGDVLQIPDGGIDKDILKVPTEDDVKEYPAIKLEMTTKGGKERVVYVMNDVLFDMILDYVAISKTGTGYIFVEPCTEKQSDNEAHLRNANYVRYWRELKDALVAANVDRDRFAPHSFRRMFAKRMWDKHHNLDLVRQLMGHSDIQTTFRYLRSDENILKVMVESQLDIKL